MAGKSAKPNSRKRAGPSSHPPSKKRKVNPVEQRKKQDNGKGKDKAYERGFISIPSVENGGDEEEDPDQADEDLAFFNENPGAGQFLSSLDQKAISRSKKEIDRLHRLHKPMRQKRQSSLPSVGSHEENGDVASWSSGISSDGQEHDLVGDGSDQDLETDASEDDGASRSDAGSISSGNSDLEQRWRQPRETADEEKQKRQGAERLPIKMADGRIQKTGNLPARDEESESETEEEADSEEELGWDEDNPRERAGVEDVATGARFGRPAVIDVISTKSRKARVQAAKEQLADICQEIIADPENSLGLLRRLHTFSLAKITSPSHPEPVPNDPLVRKLALLSQLAVFKDIIPGYRIRPLTDVEKTEKVSQMVMRTREYEQGLVTVYQSYLKVLDAEIKAKSELTEVALQSMCTLLCELTHFNFRVNIMSTIVARLSRKTWDQTSDMCLTSLIKVIKNDITGVPSLEIVRLINRMVKERHFRIQPEVLNCLLHLRLKSELGGVRASETRASKDEVPKVVDRKRDRNGKRKEKGKDGQAVHLTKRAKKTLKENKEIQAEMREAEADVDKEDRARQHTETLKLLFVLYFRILKSPHPTRLLPAALEGLSRYAHLVNIDFFRDLLAVLKDLVTRTSYQETKSQTRKGQVVENGEVDSANPMTDAEILRHRLQCITTAFELLSGQGEALTIDLGDFVNHLYAILVELAVSPDIDGSPEPTFKVVPTTSGASSARSPQPATKSLADLLFRALSLVFNPRTTMSHTPPWRTAAFAKRILISSLSWPPATVLRAVEFIRMLLVKEPRLEALLSTDDRTADGVYRPELDDPQLANPFGTSFWELMMLSRSHWDQQVREQATSLANFSKS